MSQTAVESRSPRPSATRTPDRYQLPPDARYGAPVLNSDRAYHVILLAICIAVLTMAAILSVRDGSQVLLPLLQIPLPELCTMRRLAGIDCPGCGLTRCFISLAHGDLAAAWSYNPAGLWLFAIMSLQIPFRSFQLWRISRGRAEIVLPWAAQIAFGILAMGLIVQWALRLGGMSF
jgi:hypothetical protein